MQGSYIFMLAFAIFLELAGGLLFIFNSIWGAVLLVSACIFSTQLRDRDANAFYKRVTCHLQGWFMIAVTPVMHNFWDEKENSQGRLNETINFFKVWLLRCLSICAAVDSATCDARRTWQF